MIDAVNASPYRFAELGWLQFERLCELVVGTTASGQPD
jgi:hypothetical protein